MSLGSRFVNLVSRSRAEPETGAQMQSHLALRIKDCIAAGMSPRHWQKIPVRTLPGSASCALTLPAVATCVT